MKRIGTFISAAMFATTLLGATPALANQTPSRDFVATFMAQFQRDAAAVRSKLVATRNQPAIKSDSNDFLARLIERVETEAKLIRSEIQPTHAANDNR